MFRDPDFVGIDDTAPQSQAPARVNRSLRCRGNGGAYGVALAYAGVRDFDEAFAWLDKSIEDRSLRYNIMEPAFDDLRRDSRFDRVRQKLGIRE